ncbi:MAG: hypothetical protein JEY91_03585 [Spirochaetaceae bacterium]|nr:hypothetical protein [Spirochaetaceae bacterium]
MIGPIISGLVFSAVIIILSIYRTNACRIFLGLFFIVMALGVNLPFVVTQPYFVYEYGMGAWFSYYRVLTESIIGLNPKLFGVILISFELVTGLLLLGKDSRVKIGIFLSSGFILILVPLYYSQIAWAISIPGILLLLRKNYRQNMVEILSVKLKKRQSD